MFCCEYYEIYIAYKQSVSLKERRSDVSDGPGRVSKHRYVQLGGVRFPLRQSDIVFNYFDYHLYFSPMVL